MERIEMKEMDIYDQWLMDLRSEVGAAMNAATDYHELGERLAELLAARGFAAPEALPAVRAPGDAIERVSPPWVATA